MHTMNSAKIFKSPETVVFRQRDGKGLMVKHRVTGACQKLDDEEAAYWSNWSYNFDNPQKGSQETAALLVSKGLALDKVTSKTLPESPLIDSQVPVPVKKWSKWYAESPDLFILFNSKATTFNNPLLALGPYGSLCWQGIINQWPIGKIRREAQRVFGHDEVMAFLKRLIFLGFIQQIPGFNPVSLPAEQVTKEFPAPDIQFELLHSKIPWYCLWEISSYCDLRCKTCYLPSFRQTKSDPEKVFSIAKEIIDSGIFYVSIMGGEPLLLDFLEIIISKLRNAGVFVKIISNGQRLTLDRAKALADAGLNKLEVSFDGLNQGTHEASRGQGTFDSALRAIDNTRRANIPQVAMVWTIHAGNVFELSLLPQFMSSLSIKDCYISPFKKTGHQGASGPFQPLGEVAIRDVKRQISAWHQEYPDLSVVFLPKCTCGRTSVVIGEEGELRSCSFFYESLGNILQSGILPIWEEVENNLPEDGSFGYCSFINNYQDS